MEDFWPIIGSVLGVFLVMAIGAFCRRREWLTREADRSLANLAANIMLPAYFISRILEDPELASLTTAWAPPLFGFVATTVGFAVGLLFARKIGPLIGLDSDSKQRAFALCVGICNYGYIPLPLAETFYPEAMLQLILHNVGVDLALWSVGVAIISGVPGRGWRRVMISPPFLAVIFACLMKATIDTDDLPIAMMSTVRGLGDCAIPMGLLLSGAIIVDFLGDWSWFRVSAVNVSAIVIRQLILPLLMILAVVGIGLTVEMREVVLLQAAMPAAVFPIVLVRLYGRDTETSIKVILSTSLAGIFLIPAWLLAGRWLLGV